MGFFSPRLGRIKHSPSNAATQKVRELRAEGRDIIGLTIGEPDFPTPDNVKRAVAEAMARDDTRYTTVDGTDEMKDAARLKFKRENGLVYAREQITVANGAKQIVFNAMMATLSTGDEVLIPAPYWVSYLDMALVADGTPIAITCSEDNGFKLTPAQLAAAITPRTKWLVLNSPGNPTGAHVQPRRAGSARRSAAAPSACVDIDRRYLRAPAVRRARILHDRASRAAALRPHADCQRRLQSIFDDRLAHRLRGRAQRAHAQHGEAAIAKHFESVLDQPGRRG